MSSSTGRDETSLSPEQENSLSKSGGVSTKLLEQLNAEKLDRILEQMSSETKGSELTSPDVRPAQGGYMSNGMHSFLKWVGLSLPVIVAVVCATAWINMTIDSKARENRLEMKADLDSAKVEIKAEVVRSQDDIKRLDDKIDRKMDKISDQLTSLQQEIRESKK